MRKRRIRVFLCLGAVVALIACGSRTGLLVDEVPEEPVVDASIERDAAREADVRSEDAVAEDTGFIDVKPPIDVDRRDCVDAGQTLIYLITEQYDLYSFDPPVAAFKRIGAIACPNANGATPFSMGVDRKGIAQILFNDGRIFRVSTATAACQQTTYRPNQLGFQTFGMGYASDTNGPEEKLYIAGVNNTGLGYIDANYNVTRVGPFQPNIESAELTGTGSGQLFAFYGEQEGPTFISEIDKQSGRVIGQVRFPEIGLGGGWAFAFWGGDFYLFTAPNRTSQVTRYRPSDGSRTVIARLSQNIVGAGVSTCAPQ